MIAFVALGSNLGNSREILLRAMDRLEKFSSAPLLRSSLWLAAILLLCGTGFVSAQQIKWD